MDPNFYVSVAICPDGANLKNEIRHIKSTLLYADKVNIISPVAFIYSQLTQYKNNKNLKNAIKLGLMAIKYCKGVAEKDFIDEINNMFIFLQDNYKRLSNLKVAARYKFEKDMDLFLKDITNTTISLMGESDCDELDNLIKSGNVNIEKFNYSIDQSEEFINEFIEKLCISMDSTFPLFDTQSNDIMKDILNTRVVNFNDSNKLKFKNTAFTNELMTGLPSFELLSVNEILDIKKELNNPLIRFRSKMLEYSKDIQTLPWDKEFDSECTLIYNQKILPSLIEINEVTKENSFIKNIGYDILTDKSTLGIINKVSIGIASSGLINSLTEIAKIDKTVLMGSGITAGLSTISKIAAKYKEYLENKKQIEKKDLFFYYTLKKRFN